MRLTIQNKVFRTKETNKSELIDLDLTNIAWCNDNNQFRVETYKTMNVSLQAAGSFRPDSLFDTDDFEITFLNISVLDNDRRNHLLNDYRFALSWGAVAMGRFAQIQLGNGDGVNPNLQINWDTPPEDRKLELVVILGLKAKEAV